MVFEVIDKDQRNGSNVYGCFLDCSTAFDTVERSKLFEKLLNARLPPVVLIIFIYIYRMQTARVLWKGSLSHEFPNTNGVRQGAVISPLFLSFYLDSLVNSFRLSGSGCCISQFYAGCFGYTDDLFLMCPSRKGLQNMLRTTPKNIYLL